MKRPTGTPKRTGRSPVADKRGLSKPSDGKKTGVKRHTTRPKRRGNAVVRAITGTVSLIWRIIWGSVWRLTMVVLLIIGAASAYYYTGLPEPEDLFDARARGSVTMLDHEDRFM